MLGVWSAATWHRARGCFIAHWGLGSTRAGRVVIPNWSLSTLYKYHESLVSTYFLFYLLLSHTYSGIGFTRYLPTYVLYDVGERATSTVTSEAGARAHQKKFVFFFSLSSKNIHLGASLFLAQPTFLFSLKKSNTIIHRQHFLLSNPSQRQSKSERG